MYGLVNMAVRDLAEVNGGKDLWDRIRRSAGIEHETFEPMTTYPDQMTYALVGAASKELSLPPAEVLRLFGMHWVLYTAKAGYGEIMDMFGPDFRTCLTNLNHMHARMGALMPQLVPPRFDVLEDGPSKLLVTYHSKREGLAPMVQGLLEGLAKKFGEHVEIRSVTVVSGQPATFEIEFKK